MLGKVLLKAQYTWCVAEYLPSSSTPVPRVDFGPAIPAIVRGKSVNIQLEDYPDPVHSFVSTDCYCDVRCVFDGTSPSIFPFCLRVVLNCFYPVRTNAVFRSVCFRATGRRRNIILVVRELGSTDYGPAGDDVCPIQLQITPAGTVTSAETETCWNAVYNVGKMIL